MSADNYPELASQDRVREQFDYLAQIAGAPPSIDKVMACTKAAMTRRRRQSIGALGVFALLLGITLYQIQPDRRTPAPVRTIRSTETHLTSTPSDLVHERWWLESARSTSLPPTERPLPSADWQAAFIRAECAGAPDSCDDYEFWASTACDGIARELVLEAGSGHVGEDLSPRPSRVPCNDPVSQALDSLMSRGTFSWNRSGDTLTMRSSDGSIEVAYRAITERFGSTGGLVLEEGVRGSAAFRVQDLDGSALLQVGGLAIDGKSASHTEVALSASRVAATQTVVGGERFILGTVPATTAEADLMLADGTAITLPTFETPDGEARVVAGFAPGSSTWTLIASTSSGDEIGRFTFGT